jgi:hypothetical protein
MWWQQQYAGVTLLSIMTPVGQISQAVSISTPSVPYALTSLVVVCGVEPGLLGLWVQRRKVRGAVQPPVEQADIIDLTHDAD